MSHGILEEHSLWYQYKTAIWPKALDERCDSIPPECATLHNIMRTLRAVHNNRWSYVSVPVTSGKYLFDRQLQTGLGREVLIKSVISHNYHRGYLFLTRLQDRKGETFLFPADLTPSHEHWEQEHFQALWLNIIAEKCAMLYMSPDWQYSNGAVEEFTHVMQLRLGIPESDTHIFYNTKEDEWAGRNRMRSIAVYDESGRPMGIEQGIGMVTDALAWIKSHGFEAPKIEHCRSLLKWTRDMERRGFYQ